MKKAIVSLIKRQVINNATVDTSLREIFDNSYPEIESALQNQRINNYSLHINGRNPELKKTADYATTMVIYNSIFKMNRYIPGLWDTSHRINLKVFTESGKFPSAKVEVVEFISNEKEKLQLAAYFETDLLILLDNIGDKLLLSFPNTTGEDDATQTDFTNTFFLQLTDDIYFGSYKLLY